MQLILVIHPTVDGRIMSIVCNIVLHCLAVLFVSTAAGSVFEYCMYTIPLFDMNAIHVWLICSCESLLNVSDHDGFLHLTLS